MDEQWKELRDKAAYQDYTDTEEDLDPFEMYNYLEKFKAGANWQKERMDAVVVLQADYIGTLRSLVKTLIDAGMVSGSKDLVWKNAVELANNILED